jgi:hypothetical protein
VSDVPAWLLTHAQKCRVAFGLEDWDIVPGFTQLGEDDHTQVAGVTHANPRYQHGTVDFLWSIQDDDAGHRIVTHELLHCAQAYEEQAVARIIELVPKARRKHAWALWRDGNEQATQRLARGLTPLLQAMQRVDTDPASPPKKGKKKR